MVGPDQQKEACSGFTCENVNAFINETPREEKMFKQITVGILSLSLLLGTVGLAIAADKGNERKGKYLFRKNCRTCHIEGGEAKELSPITFTQAQWEEAFKPEKVAGYPCQDKWAELSEKDRNDIYAYMYNHAADSPSPAKCK